MSLKYAMKERRPLMVSFIFLFISLVPLLSVQNGGCVRVQRLLQAQEKNCKYCFSPSID